MKREDLRKLGLTDEQVDQVMSMNGDDVNAQKAIVAQRDETITALTTERDGLKEQVTARDKDIADLKKAAGDNESLNKQLSDLQTKYNDDYKIAMLLHSFSWSVITFMPVFIMYRGHLGLGDWQAGVIIGVNSMIHYWIDDKKCNWRSINLVQDQILHLLQILLTLLIFGAIKGFFK